MNTPPSAASPLASLLTETAQIAPQQAARLAAHYASGALSVAERQVIEEMFRRWQREAETAVRETLAHELCTLSHLPLDVAMAMARDSACVAIPMLRWSEVLTGADLLSIIAESREGGIWQAIAERREVPEAVSDALIATGDETAVATLVTNDGAHFSAQAPLRIAETFPEHHAIAEAMLAHPRIPAQVLDLLIAHCGEHLRAHLERRYRQPKYTLVPAMERSQTLAFLRQLPDHAPLERIEEYVAMRLLTTPREEWLLHTLALGRSRLFLASLARCAGIPYQNAEKLAADRQGFSALWQKAGMPAAAAECARDHFDRVQAARAEPRWRASGWPERWKILLQMLGPTAELSPETFEAQICALLRKAVFHSHPLIRPAIMARKIASQG
jgi:uncharacterized protein (DUF2336 family)